MTALTVGLLAASVAGNILLAILYGRAVKGATERAQFEKKANALTLYAKVIAQQLELKEKQLRELQKKFVEKLSDGDLATELSAMFGGGEHGGGKLPGDGTPPKTGAP